MKKTPRFLVGKMSFRIDFYRSYNLRKAQKMSENREAAAAASLFASASSAPPEMDTHAVTLRVPVDDYCQLSAMAQIAGISKSAMALRAISAGMTAIRFHIQPDVNEEISELGQLMYEAYIGENDTLGLTPTEVREIRKLSSSTFDTLQESP